MFKRSLLILSASAMLCIAGVASDDALARPFDGFHPHAGVSHPQFVARGGRWAGRSANGGAYRRGGAANRGAYGRGGAAAGGAYWTWRLFRISRCLCGRRLFRVRRRLCGRRLFRVRRRLCERRFFRVRRRLCGRRFFRVRRRLCGRRLFRIRRRLGRRLQISRRRCEWRRLPARRLRGGRPSGRRFRTRWIRRRRPLPQITVFGLYRAFATRVGVPASRKVGPRSPGPYTSAIRSRASDIGRVLNPN